MTTLYIPRDMFDMIDDMDTMVCVFCDNEVHDTYCHNCQEYKGLMTIAEWEAYTGEVWEY